MAGMAATVFAVNRGLSVCQVGSTREIGFASGLFDLLGIHPIGEGKEWDNPWEGIDTLIRDIPQHPYSRLSQDDIRSAFDELLQFLAGAGLPYKGYRDRNARLITHVGTVKMTYCVPQTMWDGVEAFEQKRPCLIVDFHNLKGFSAGLIANTLKMDWPGLRAVSIAFPSKAQFIEVLPEQLANTLVIQQNRERLARQIQPHLRDAQVVGMPAVLGLYQSAEVTLDMKQRLGVPVFEISTMPPSIPGLRLKEAFDRILQDKRSHYFPQQNVSEVKQEDNGRFTIGLGGIKENQKILSQGVILATGRFIGGGLHADRKRISETIFNLPVHQPKTRGQWHREEFLDKQGHLINQAGLEIDDHFRPVGRNGQPVYENLYAVGSILAHQDWKRMKCGVGLAVATAFGAVKAIITNHEKHPPSL
jgi:glycerol-3-phosphate dehydrogenase subunit B